jgi:glycosyltransferase involved in cell wall biosynthesis
MKKMKSNNTTLAFVTDSIWPYNTGGKEKRLYDISQKLVRENYQVHIYTMKWWKGSNIKNEDGATLHAISPLYPLYSGPRRSIKEALLFGLACLKLITEKWNDIDIDQMPFFPVYSIKLVCLLKRKSMSATWHEVWGKKYWQDYLGPIGILAYWIEKLSVRLPNQIISVSALTTSRLIQMFGSKNVITIPDEIDAAHIQSILPSVQKSDIIYAGRLLAHKNVDLLIKSLALLKTQSPNIKCLIIGNGPENNSLKKLSLDLKLTENITFSDFLEKHDELYSLIKSARVFVLPSSREGFGIVVAEALACGTPVVTTNHPDNAAKELITPGSNGYISNMDEHDLANKISLAFNL